MTSSIDTLPESTSKRKHKKYPVVGYFDCGGGRQPFNRSTSMIPFIASRQYFTVFGCTSAKTQL